MKILIPIDGSVYSDNAIDYICHRPSIKENADTIYLLNVQKKVAFKGDKRHSEEIEEALDHAARAVIKPAKKRLEEAGYKVKSRICFGKATNQIVNAAKEIKASLIVMGSHGRTPVKGILFGSKTSSVLASTKEPMLVIRHKSAKEGQRAQVGICVDGSDYGKAAIDYVQKHLQLFGNDPVFHLINVAAPFNSLLIPEAAAFGAPSMSREEFDKEQREPFANNIEPLCEQLNTIGVQTKVVMLKGDVAEEIAQYAKQAGLSLLVLGTHGHSKLKVMMLGSTAMKIASLCELPMLLVHKDGYFEQKNK